MDIENKLLFTIILHGSL